MARDPLVIWLITDRKPGHFNQLQGLSSALCRLTTARPLEIDAPPTGATLTALITRRFAPAADLPDPDLILCAGHATHLPGIAARRARGGRLVVLMRPSLPLRCFDLTLIPDHDGPPGSDRVIATRGALTTVQPSPAHDPEQGLILVGGPSKRHGWDEAALLDRVATIARRSEGIRWRLTDSRRTPPTFGPALRARRLESIDYTPAGETGPQWVRERLETAGTVWVTEDSVSMLYEAMSGGARVGVLPAPRVREDRVVRGVDDLIARGLATPFEAWESGRALAPPDEPLDEAARCARAILDRFFPDRGAGP